MIQAATLKKAFKVPLQLRRTAPLSREAAQLGSQQVMLETICICFLVSVYILLHLSMTAAGNYLYSFSYICVFVIDCC